MEFTEEETRELVERFKEMGVKPKTSTKDDFEEWMRETVQQDVKPNATPELKVVQQSFHKPKLPIFSGDQTGSKEQVSFDLWEFAVNSLISEGKHSPQTIMESARGSLRGSAARVCLRLGPGRTVQHLLEKLKGIYGVVEHGESILSEFYAAQQGRDEDVASWSCKIEDILEKAIEKGQVTRMASVGMLRSKLWNGLRQELKDSTRHYFDSDRGYDALRVELRKVEYENKLKPKATAQCKLEAALESPRVSLLEKELKAVKDQLTQMAKVQSHHIPPKDQHQQRRLGKHGGSHPNRGQQAYAPSETASGQPSYTRMSSFNQSQSQAANMPYDSQLPLYPGSSTPAYGNSRPPQGPRFPSPTVLQERGPQCWRCGGYGHLKVGCLVRIDHLRRCPNEEYPYRNPPAGYHPLNFKRPTQPGGQ